MTSSTECLMPRDPSQPARTAQPNGLSLKFAPTWPKVLPVPPNPILAVSDAFRACTSPVKINLGVGAYRTKKGNLSVVYNPASLFVLISKPWQQAQAAVVAAKYNKEYLGTTGLPQQGVELLSKALKIGHPLGILSELDKASLHGGTICAADQADRLFLMTNIEAFPSRGGPRFQGFKHGLAGWENQLGTTGYTLGHLPT
ncbi:hypothetical protein PSTT_00916 [Puccinia striiformis]|uniref:Aspartate transaminase n=1 Tax=Puccinia striiformis TaxID=27350 RepID=A0A2S4W5D6_9BASI|nr:hypothetical protein PSTT_00916 [Puccinia striiformis]